MADQMVGLVIPCYNEAHRLKQDDILRALNVVKYLSILFVDDGSTDKTQKVLHDFCQKVNDPFRCRYIQLSKNQGKGEAVRQGISYFLKQDQVDIIGYWDADMATPLSCLEELLSIFTQKKYVLSVIGSRVKLCGRNIKRYSGRHYLARIYVTFLNVFLHTYDIYDTQCGAKLFKKEVLKGQLDNPFISRWLFDIELFYRIKEKKQADFSDWLYEYSLPEWTEIPGSKVTWKSFCFSFWDAFKIYLKYKP